MNITPASLIDGNARVFDLRISLSQHFDAQAIDHWRKRLHTYVSAHGLIAVISPEHIIVLPNLHDQPLGPFHKGIVLGWLVSQPEVVLVRVERPHQLAPVGIRQMPGQSVTVLEFRHGQG